jgi:phenylpropionate dioxygenase-like ring-hydroxylating dioxygenase large terminal subunit
MAEIGLHEQKTDVTARVVYGLPARWYWERDIYQAERRQIFAREWQLVGPASDLPKPGDYVAAEVAGYRFFVIRDRDGALRGFHNVCPHRASQLLDDGAGHCDLLRCRYHGWVFDTAGNLRRAPDFGEAEWFRKEAHGLMPIRIETWRGLVFANFDHDAPALIDALGSLPETVKDYPIESFTKVRQAEFEMHCNWKNYTDNFVEGYHIPGIHPSFNAVIDFSKFETTHRDALVIMTAPQKNGSIYGGLWLWGWPNFTLSVYPGGMNCSRIVPVAENRTRLVYSFFFRDVSDAAKEANERTIETNCDIVREDFGICERSQANLEAGIFQRGPLSPRHEVGVRYFHDRVRQAMAREGIVEGEWLRTRP